MVGTNKDKSKKTTANSSPPLRSEVGESDGGGNTVPPKHLRRTDETERQATATRGKQVQQSLPEAVVGKRSKAIRQQSQGN